MKLTSVLSIVFLCIFAFFLTILFDERWQYTQQFFSQSDYVIPSIFSWVAFLQTAIWVVGIPLVLFCLFCIEIQNPLRTAFMCAIVLGAGIFFRNMLDHIGLFTDEESSKVYLQSLSLAVFLLLLAGFRLSTERVWRYFSLPNELLATFDEKLELRDHPLPLKIVLPAVFMIWFALTIMEEEIPRIYIEDYYIDNVVVDNDYPSIPTHEKKNLSDGISLVTYHLPYLKNIEEDLMLQIDIRPSLKSVDKETLQMDLQSHIDGFENMTQYIYKQPNVQKDFTTEITFGPGYPIEDSEYLYLTLLRDLHKQLPGRTLTSHSTFKTLGRLNIAVRELYATPKRFYVESSQLLWSFENSFKEDKQYQGFELFSHSLYTSNFISLREQKLRQNNKVVYTLNAKVNYVATSHLGAMTFAQIGETLYRFQHNWQWPSQPPKIAFPYPIIKMIFNHDGEEAYILTQDRRIFVCYTENMEVKQLAQFTIDVYDIVLSRDSHRLFLASNQKNLHFLDLAKGKYLRLTGDCGPIYDLDISLGGRILIGGGAKKTVYMWDIVKLEEFDRCITEDVITNIAFTPYSESNFVVVLRNGKVMASIGN